MNLIYNIDQIADVARQFWKEAGSFKVFAIHGPMGAGKTSVGRYLAKQLNLHFYILKEE